MSVSRHHIPNHLMPIAEQRPPNTFQSCLFSSSQSNDCHRTLSLHLCVGPWCLLVSRGLHSNNILSICCIISWPYDQPISVLPVFITYHSCLSSDVLYPQYIPFYTSLCCLQLLYHSVISVHASLINHYIQDIK